MYYLPARKVYRQRADQGVMDTTIKNISRLIKSINATLKRSRHFCINYQNGFQTVSARDKQYEYCSSDGYVRVKMFPEKKISTSSRFHSCYTQTLRAYESE